MHIHNPTRTPKNTPDTKMTKFEKKNLFIEKFKK